ARSRIQHPLAPFAGQVALIQHPLVEAVPGAVPELQVQRADPYSRPARRTRDFAPFELLLDLGDPLLEALPGFHRFGLLGGPRSDLAAATAAGEVRVRLLAGDQLHRPFAADLPPFVHARPVD